MREQSFLEISFSHSHHPWAWASSLEPTGFRWASRGAGSGFFFSQCSCMAEQEVRKYIWAKTLVLRSLPSWEDTLMFTFLPSLFPFSMNEHTLINKKINKAPIWYFSSGDKVKKLGDVTRTDSWYILLLSVLSSNQYYEMLWLLSNIIMLILNLLQVPSTAVITLWISDLLSFKK